MINPPKTSDGEFRSLLSRDLSFANWFVPPAPPRRSPGPFCFSGFASGTAAPLWNRRPAPSPGPDPDRRGRSYLDSPTS